MSRPASLTVRLVRLAAGVAIALPAVSMYGAAGAWADRAPGNSPPGNSAPGNSAPGNSAPGNSDHKGSPGNSAPGNSDHNGQAGAPAAADDATRGNHGQSKKADTPAEVTLLTAPLGVAAVTTAVASSDHSKGNGSTVGSPSSPQPLSNANMNQGGANNGGACGAYCSTRNGSPSMNGNGGGNAGGRPCAGCVGKADNKNPPGQAPNGSDHNNGYECDGNNGVGKGNPAHTSCRTSTTGGTTGGTTGTTTGTTTGGTTTGGTTGTTTGGTTTGGTTGTTTGGTTGITTGGSSGAQTTGGTTGITTGGSSGAQTTGGTTGGKICPPATGAQAVSGPMPRGCRVQANSGGATALPFTGLDVTALLGVALVLAGLGLGLSAAGGARRQRLA